MSIGPIVALGDENGADGGKWDLRETVRGYPKPLLLLLADPSDSVVFPEDVTFVARTRRRERRDRRVRCEGHTLHRTASTALRVRRRRFCVVA